MKTRQPLSEEFLYAPPERVGDWYVAESDVCADGKDDESGCSVTTAEDQDRED